METSSYPKKLIGEILIEEGFLEREFLMKALEIQRKDGGLIGEILLHQGWIREEELIAGLSRQLNLPFIQLSNYSLNPKASRLVTREFALKYLLIPFEVQDSRCSIAMSSPPEKSVMEELEKILQHRVQIFLASPSEIRKSIDLHLAPAS